MKSKFLAVVRNYSNRVSRASCALNVACMGEWEIRMQLEVLKLKEKAT